MRIPRPPRIPHRFTLFGAGAAAGSAYSQHQRSKSLAEENSKLSKKVDDLTKIAEENLEVSKQTEEAEKTIKEQVDSIKDKIITRLIN